MEDIIRVEIIEDPEEKANIVKDVLSDLPDWFGIPESTNAYINESKHLPLWAAKADNEIIGFVTFKETSKDAGEIHCMGVKKAYHRKGIGTQLYLALEKYAKEKYKLYRLKQ